MRISIGIACLFLTLFLAAPSLNAEGTATPAPASVTCAFTPLVASSEQPILQTEGSENQCGASCPINGAQDECVGYNGCGWLQVDACNCVQGHWRCVWPC
jgi:hypothetical protein